MFGSLLTVGESHKRFRYEKDGLLVSTVRVTDSSHPYETAVGHPEYNGGDLIIVEEYDTEEAAKAGHEKWVATMTAPTLPESLTDVSTAESAMVLARLGVSRTFARQSE